jgi:hypothetical protein
MLSFSFFLSPSIIGIQRISAPPRHLFQASFNGYYYIINSKLILKILKYGNEDAVLIHEICDNKAVM